MKLSENYQRRMIGIIESVQRRASGLSRGSADAAPPRWPPAGPQISLAVGDWWAELREAELCLLPWV